MAKAEEPDYSRTVFSLSGHGIGNSDENRLPVLVVLRGAQVGRRYLLNESSLVLGRRADRAQLVVLGDQQVSSVHCRIERVPEPDTWQIVDLKSTNGTYVAGVKVDAARLREGDRIQLGETVLKFCFHDELEEEFHRQVDHLMNVDDLTGLPVQRVYQARFHDALQACQAGGRPIAVFMMDLDGLKGVNDRHGHLVGAHAIATVGQRLGALVHESGGTVSRFGGDEFSAFVPGLARAGCLALAERMRARVADQPIVRGTVTVNPTISIGVAGFPDDGTVAEALTRRADEALYRAKAAGRNRASE